MVRRFIAVIGNAHASRALEDAAFEVGREVVRAGFSLVCGGLGGVMRAACRGAREARGEGGAGRDAVVMGILPGVHRKDANDFVDVVVPTGLGYARNALVVLAGDGVIAVGGGSGTLSEIALAWQYHKPIVALTSVGGWSARLAGERVDERRSDHITPAKDASEAVRLLAEMMRAGPPS